MIINMILTILIIIIVLILMIMVIIVMKIVRGLGACARWIKGLSKFIYYKFVKSLSYYYHY